MVDCGKKNKMKVGKDGKNINGMSKGGWRTHSPLSKRVGVGG